VADDPKTAIWTPDGVKVLGGKAPERVELTPGVGEWFVQFAEVAAALRIGVHCGYCGKDLIGKNSDTDQVFTTACGCREFIWKNRDYRPPPAVTH